MEGAHFQARRLRIGEILIKEGFLTPEWVEAALKTQKITGEKLGEIFVRWGKIRRKDLVAVLVKYGYSIEELVEEIEPEFFIPPSVCLRLGVMLLFEQGDKVYVATINPDVEGVKKELERALKKKVIFVSVSSDEINSFLSFLKKELEEERFWDVGDDPKKYLERTVKKALWERASDVHVELREDALYIRFRVDTVLYLEDVKPKDFGKKLVASAKDVSGMDASDNTKPQDGGFSLKFRKRPVDIRAAFLPTVDGAKMTFRLLDREKNAFRIEELGITRLDLWKELATLPYGLVLVCGPTGSGKTTTLYTTIRELINVLRKSVYSVEDPVEYKMAFVGQTQVNERAGNTFAAFSRAVLRHDPDVVVVGETRDEETAQTVVTLADTGHLVYTTLHTGNVVQSFFRFLNLGVKKEYVKYLLKGILVQRLVRKLCKNCRGKGCSYCKEGYKGVTVVSEIAVFRTPDDFEKMIKGELKYHTFEYDAALKIKAGITDLKEIKRVFGYALNYSLVEKYLSEFKKESLREK